MVASVRKLPAIARYLATLLAALAGALLGAFLIIPFGLAISELIVVPVALLVSALLSALAAVWVSNIVGRRTGTRLGPIVVLSESAALITVVLWVALAFSPVSGFFPPIGLIVIALAATLATWRFRAPDLQLRSHLLATVFLIGVAGVIVVVALFIVAPVLGVVEGPPPGTGLLTVYQEIEGGSYPQGGVSYLRVESEAGRVVVDQGLRTESAPLAGPSTDARMLVERRLRHGVYRLTSYQRRCIDTCTRLGAPRDRCSGRFEIGPEGAVSIVRLRPGKGCTLVFTDVSPYWS